MKSFIESSETEATEQRGDAPQDRHNPQRGMGMRGFDCRICQRLLIRGRPRFRNAVSSSNRGGQGCRDPKTRGSIEYSHPASLKHRSETTPKSACILGLRLEHVQAFPIPGRDSQIARTVQVFCSLGMEGDDLSQPRQLACGRSDLVWRATSFYSFQISLQKPLS